MNCNGLLNSLPISLLVSHGTVLLFYKISVPKFGEFLRVELATENNPGPKDKHFLIQIRKY